MHLTELDQDSSPEVDNDLPITPPPDELEVTTPFEAYTPDGILETVGFNLVTLSPDAVISEWILAERAQSMSLEECPTIMAAFVCHSLFILTRLLEFLTIHNDSKLRGRNSQPIRRPLSPTVSGDRQSG